MMATKNKEIYRKKEDGSLELVGYLPTEDVSSRVDEAESSINNLNNAVADRYTKAETDVKLDEKLSIITSSPKYWFEGNGEHRFCKIATITARNSWANRPIVFECIGRGMDSRQIISISPSGSSEATGTAFTNITKTTNDLVWALKDEGNGVGSLYVMLSEPWGNVQVLRVSYYGYVNVEMKMEPCDGFPDGSIIAKNVITALLADTATTADNATHANNADVADNFAYGRGVYLSADSVNENTSWVKAVFGDEGDRHFHITEVRTQGTGPKYIPGNYSAGIAWKGADTYGALTVSYNFANAYICGGNGTSPAWGRNIVLSENGSNIADQSVAYADRAGYANSSGTAAVCESTTLLAAEGTNLGAKIRSQYTSGSLGGGVTYHQATWYVTGNDGDTYNFSKMITTDNFGTNLTEALKNTKIEYSTRSDYATYLDYRNDDSTSIPISYDSDQGTSLKYTSYPKLFINGITGYGVLEGNVYNHGSFQLAVSDNSNGTIYIRSVAKDESAPSWAKLLIDDDVINSLDSDIINRPLSAYQGKVMSGKITSINSSITSINSSIASINSKFLDYQPKLNSETGATMQWLSFKKGSSYSISGIWCGKVEMTIDGSVGTQANANFTVDTTYQSTFSSGSWYFVAMPCEGGYINTLSWGLETNSSNTGGTLYALRVYSGVRTKYKFNIIGIRLW